MSGPLGRWKHKVTDHPVDNEGYETVLLPLLEGQSLIRESEFSAIFIPGSASLCNRVPEIKEGDPRLRLEKYFSSVVSHAVSTAYSNHSLNGLSFSALI